MPKKLALSAGALILLFGTTAPADAQHEHEMYDRSHPGEGIAVMMSFDSSTDIAM